MNDTWDIGGISDSPEVTATRWAARKNWLKIVALENKLKTLDPALVEWEETAQDLFLAQEAQKRLAHTAVMTGYEHQRRQDAKC